MRPTLGHQSMSELEAQYMRLTMMPNQLPITYDSEISKTLQSIIKLRTEELRKHQEQCPVLSMSHDDSMNQMTDEYNIDHLESDYLAAGIPERFRLDKMEMLSRKAQDEYFASKEASCKNMAFMATPVKRSKATTMNHDSFEDSRDFDAISESESEYSEAESNSSSQSFKGWVKSLGLETSITSQDEDPEDSTPDTSGSCNEEPETPPPQIHRQGSKKRSFVFPKESRIKRSAACARIKEALDQVPYSVHLNSRGDRDTATLYVGNIDYNASEQDLSKALDKIFQRIRVEKVTIPRVNGRSMYGFIEISWARKAPVKASDLCIHWSSGRVTVNGRPIYFRESCGKEDSE
jgi:hypothetical protein